MYIDSYRSTHATQSYRCLCLSLCLSLSISRFRETFGSLEPLRVEVQDMTEELNRLNLPNVFCHNDLLSGNLIYNAQEGELLPWLPVSSHLASLWKGLPHIDDI